jgi:hypothetical protein
MTCHKDTLFFFYRKTIFYMSSQQYKIVQFETIIGEYANMRDYFDEKRIEFNRLVKLSPISLKYDPNDATRTLSKDEKMRMGELFNIKDAAVRLAGCILSMVRNEIENMADDESRVEEYKMWMSGKTDYLPLETNRRQLFQMMLPRKERATAEITNANLSSIHSHLLTLSQKDFGFILGKVNTSRVKRNGKIVELSNGHGNFILHISKEFLTCGRIKPAQPNHVSDANADPNTPQITPQKDALKINWSSPNKPEIARLLIENFDKPVSNLKTGLIKEKSIKSGVLSEQLIQSPIGDEIGKQAATIKKNPNENPNPEAEKKQENFAPARPKVVLQIVPKGNDIPGASLDHANQNQFQKKIDIYANLLANQAESTLFNNANRIQRPNGIHKLDDVERQTMRHMLKMWLNYVIQDVNWQKGGAKISEYDAYRILEIALSKQARLMRLDKKYKIYRPSKFFSLATNQDGSWEMAKGSLVKIYESWLQDEFERLKTRQYQETRLTTLDGVRAIARKKAQELVDSVVEGKINSRDDKKIQSIIVSQQNWIEKQCKALAFFNELPSVQDMHRCIVSQVFQFEIKKQVQQ